MKGLRDDPCSVGAGPYRTGVISPAPLQRTDDMHYRQARDLATAAKLRHALTKRTPNPRLFAVARMNLAEA